MTAPSAKSLFKAISGRASAPEVLPLLPMELPTMAPPADGARVALDFHPTTQTDAIRGLLLSDGERIRECGSVWEPACGNGALVMPIRSAGIPCSASDIVDRGCPDSWVADYYTCLKSRARAIITNPPYCEINARDGHGRWLRHTLDMPGWDYLALLLSWDWPAAHVNGLKEILDEAPFSYCYLMRWKIDFTGQGSPPQRNAWFVWDWKMPPGEPLFRWMNKPMKGEGREATA